jgi:hypothetical protein
MLARTHRNSSPISEANESTRGPKCRFVLLGSRNEIQTIPPSKQTQTPSIHVNDSSGRLTGRLRIGNDGHLGRFNDLALADKRGIRHQFGNVLCPERRTWVGECIRTKDSCQRHT